MPGIIDTRYYLVNRKVRFTIDPDKITPEKVLSAIKTLGMSPSLQIQGKQPTRKASPVLLYSTIASLVLFFLALGIRQFNGGIPVVNALLLLSMGLGGWNVFRRGYYSLLNLNFDMNVLMSIAVIGAVYLKDFIEAAVVVILFSVAHLIENYTIEKARKAIGDLMDAAPQTSRVERDDGSVTVTPSESVEPGQVILINSNERIPLDGDVLRGSSSVNQASITGESVPVDKSPGDQVFAGTINQSGTLAVHVTHRYHDTQIARIVEMVEQAQARKAPAQNFVDRFARIYTPPGYGCRSPGHHGSSVVFPRGFCRHVLPVNGSAAHRLSLRTGHINAGYCHLRALPGRRRRNTDKRRASP